MQRQHQRDGQQAHGSGVDDFHQNHNPKLAARANQRPLFAGQTPHVFNSRRQPGPRHPHCGSLQVIKHIGEKRRNDQ